MSSKLDPKNQIAIYFKTGCIRLLWLKRQFGLIEQDGEDDLKKGTQLLEIYALEIQMYTAQKNNKKLKALYDQSLHIKSAIPHPLILGKYL